MTSSKRESSSRRRKKAAKRERFLKYLKQNTWLVLLAVLILVALVLLILVIAGSGSEEKTQTTVKTPTNAYHTAYICGVSAETPVYNNQLEKTGAVQRGTQVTYSTDKPVTYGSERYYLTYLDGLQNAYVSGKNLTENADKVVQETEIFVRSPQNLRLSAENYTLGSLLEKGSELQVLGYDYLENGAVHLYRVKSGNEVGYISGLYTAATAEEADEIYDRFGVYMTHSMRGDTWGGGDGGSLDYFPRAKASFIGNTMPESVYGLYLTCDHEVLSNIDAYIEYAKTTSINAFVVNIMDGTSVGYPSEVYLEYSPTAYTFANNTVDEFRTCIQKIKDAGFYAIGRLTTFNDSFFVTDHPEFAISGADGKPLYIANSYWPSAFCRYAWEYKVALAQEAVATMGFDEIQFDYVRFPDGTYDYEQSGNIDYHNLYGETKAQAIQRFLMYATDALHDSGVYVGADVFGETSGTYVTAYGQYWPAISNVVDVISGMPYPDHFSQNGSYLPWEHPYETIYDWACAAAKRQQETPSPAAVRTWIQAYNAIRAPYNTYGAKEVGDEIQALKDGGLTGGFMAWNAACSLSKLEELKPAFDALGAVQ